MKKIYNINPMLSYAYTGLITLIFFESFLFFLLFICLVLYKDIGIFTSLPLAIANIMFIRGIFICIRDFISEEECWCQNERFYYRKVLWKIFILREIELSVIEINKVEDIGDIDLRKGYYHNAAYFIYFFNPHFRLKFNLNSGKEIRIWNYKKINFPLKFNEDSLYTDELLFIDSIFTIKAMIEINKKLILEEQKLKELRKKYFKDVESRYNFILNEIIKDEILYLSNNKNQFIINASKEAIEKLQIFRDIHFEKVNYFVFYVKYLSKKENQDKKVIVGYNGVDGKETTFKELKEDINKIRDSKSVLLTEIK